jgi:lipopolysaccharide transport system permease protein
VTLPLFTGLAFIAALGVGLWLSALNVKYRDFRYVIPFIVQFGIFISPVFFTSSVFRAKHSGPAYLWYDLNPMVAVIDGYRWALGGAAPLNVSSLSASLAVTFLIMVSGLLYFRATEKAFADII